MRIINFLPHLELNRGVITMIQQFKEFIDSKCPGAQPLFIAIRGSRAYGTNLPTSDTDYAGIFIQTKEDIFGTKWKEQIHDNKHDIVFYEIRRFLELASSNNPTILELLNTPEDSIIFKHPLWDLILDHRDKFITKVCAKSFAGYAIQQIKKARGLNKKQNWEKDKVTRKNPLDFCFIHQNEYSIELSKYLEANNLRGEYCGLSKVPHGRDVYSLFYDTESHHHKLAKSPIFRGIAFENSNDIRLSSISSGSHFIGHISYNKDGYTQHCNDWRSYITWLEERNVERWTDVESHGQKIDGKNMMHCRRLLNMAKEIGEGKGIRVRRENAQDLIDIRKGLVTLESLIAESESDIQEIQKLFLDSNLPDSVDAEFVNWLLVEIRGKFYQSIEYKKN